MNEMNIPKDAARQILTRFGYRPPLNITAVVNEHGISIVRRRVERSVAGLLIVDPSRVTMLVNQAFEASQQRFVLAHLLGHFVLHAQSSAFIVDFLRPGLSKTTDERRCLMEREADQFACELLIPEHVLRECMKKKSHCGARIFARPLAAHFGVSEIMFALRLSELGFDPRSSGYSWQL